MRIVSLVPSWTEWLFDLGCGDDVVGLTKFCVHPRDRFERTPRVGGTKRVDIERVRALAPDLIVANREENVREQVEALAEFAPVLVTDVPDVPMAWREMERVAEAVGRAAAGREWVARIQESWGPPRPVAREVAYLIWAQPWMTVGGDTYISSVLGWWGARNVFADQTRYPTVDGTEPAWNHRPEVLLSSEPFPFAERHAETWRARGFRATFVDGEAFSWYGSRMAHAVETLRHWAET
jgi:ABC-type Fe3+-hydroxamate transport system substrate-binding protein